MVLNILQSIIIVGIMLLLVFNLVDIRKSKKEIKKLLDK